MELVIDGGPHLVCVKVKASTTVRGEDFKHLRWFATDGTGRGRSCMGIVFYLGAEKLTFGDGNFALPVSTLWSDVVAN